MHNLTKSYPFESMSVGSSFVVRQRFQHARVAASEYARRHNMCFTCRMQEDGSMIVYRVELDQRPVDQRGRNGRRKIVTPVDPNRDQFIAWLLSFAVGQSYPMPNSYSHLWLAMEAWAEIASLRHGRTYNAVRSADTLLLRRNA